MSPITREEFFKESFKVHEYTGEKIISAFLRKNESKAYTARELIKETKYSFSTIIHYLRKLVKKRKILHDKPYYIWKRKK